MPETMSETSTGRRTLIREIVSRRIAKWALAVVTVLSVAQIVREFALPRIDQEKFNFHNVSKLQWPWYVWAIIVLIVVVVTIFEGALAAVRERESKLRKAVTPDAMLPSHEIAIRHLDADNAQLRAADGNLQERIDRSDKVIEALSAQVQELLQLGAQVMSVNARLNATLRNRTLALAAELRLAMENVASKARAEWPRFEGNEECPYPDTEENSTVRAYWYKGQRAIIDGHYQSGSIVVYKAVADAYERDFHGRVREWIEELRQVNAASPKLIERSKSKSGFVILRDLPSCLEEAAEMLVS
jgi:hypothetical protein